MINKCKNKTYNFLRWTEKWTKTDMIYLTKGGFWLSISQGISMFSALLLSIAFANLLPINIYGEYKYILSIASFLSIPTLSGMQGAINRAAAKGYDGVLMTGIKTSIKWGSLASLTSLALSLYYYINKDTTLTFSSLIIAIFIPFVGPLNSFTSFLQGKKLFKLSTKLNIIREFTITSITALSLLLTNNIFILIFIYFASRTLIRYLLLKIVIHQTKPNRKEDETSITLGKHFSAMGILEMVANQIDKILIWHYLGAAQLAIYSFAMAPINQIKGAVMKNISILAFPKLAQNTTVDIKKNLPIKVLKLSILTILLAIIYSFSAPFIFKFIFPQYTNAVIYSIFFSITLALAPISLFNTVLIAKGLKKKLYTISTTVNVFKIILFFILLPKYGILGGILTLVLVNLYSQAIQTYYMVKL